MMSAARCSAPTRITIHPATLEHFLSPNIPGVLQPITSVLLAVVLHDDFGIFPAHVEMNG